MSKVKDFFLNVKVSLKDKVSEVKNWEDKRKYKIAKILSFFVGAIFSFCGVIAVAIWKYLFCSKEENSKYCIRLSIFGMVVRWMVYARLLTSSFSPLFIGNDYNYVKFTPFNGVVIKDGGDIVKVGVNGIEIKSKNNKYKNKDSKKISDKSVKHPVNNQIQKDEMFIEDLDDFMQPMFVDFSTMQRQMQDEFNTIQGQMEQRFSEIQKQANQMMKNRNDKVKTHTITKKDGVMEETTLIEIPNGYKKVVRTTYNSNDEPSKITKTEKQKTKNKK